VTRDLALVLDVARFKYPPHWVPIERMWLAMQPVDSASNRSRGWMLVRRGPSPPAVCCSVRFDARKSAAWDRFVKQELRSALLAGRPRTVEDAVGLLLKAVPDELVDLVLFCETAAELPSEHRRMLDSVLDAVAALPHYATFLREAHGDPDRSARLALLFLLLPDNAFEELPPNLRSELSRMRDPAALPSTLSAEVCRVQFQLSALAEGAARI
jgi:glutathione gamma-glutamylcysteinyltransferase